MAKCGLSVLACQLLIKMVHEYQHRVIRLIAKEVIRRLYGLNCESAFTLGVPTGNIYSCSDKLAYVGEDACSFS